MKIKQIIYSLLLCGVSAVYSGANEPVYVTYVAMQHYQRVCDLLSAGRIQDAEKLALSPDFEGDSFIDPKRGTFLHLLAFYDCVDIAKKILKDEHLNMKSGEYKATSLFIAAEYGRLRMFKFLLEKGADANIAARIGGTPLKRAAANGHVSIVKLCCPTTSCNLKDALFAAAGRNRKEVVEYLLSQGADKTERDEKGKLPVDYATDKAVARLLALPIKQDGTLSAKTRGCRGCLFAL